MVKQLLETGLVFGTLIVALVIVGVIATQTYEVGKGVATNDTLVDSLWDSGNTALTTFADFLPIIAIAVVGGLAIAYMFGFMRSGSAQ